MTFYFFLGKIHLYDVAKDKIVSKMKDTFMKDNGNIILRGYLFTFRNFFLSKKIFDKNKSNKNFEKNRNIEFFGSFV